MSQAPTVHRTSITRPARLAACAVLAVILNAGAIGLAAEASSLRWDGVTASVSEKPRLVAMLLVGAPDAAAIAPTISRDAAPVVNNHPPSVQRHVPANLPTARTTPLPTATEPVHQVMFYTFREVDSPAFPETDWNLDVEALDQIGVQRLVFEVLISDRGEVVGCTVFEPFNLADDVKRGLEKRLSETNVLPALRAGQLVASVRRIELLVAAARPDLPADPAAHRP